MLCLNVPTSFIRAFFIFVIYVFLLKGNKLLLLVIFDFCLFFGVFPQIYTTCIGLICMNLASMYNQAQLIIPIYIKTGRLVRTPNFGNTHFKFNDNVFHYKDSLTIKTSSFRSRWVS